jgi:hypothetical protein
LEKLVLKIAMVISEIRLGCGAPSPAKIAVLRLYNLLYKEESGARPKKSGR